MVYNFKKPEIHYLAMARKVGEQEIHTKTKHRQGLKALLKQDYLSPSNCSMKRNMAVDDFLWRHRNWGHKLFLLIFWSRQIVNDRPTTVDHRLNFSFNF